MRIPVTKVIFVVVFFTLSFVIYEQVKHLQEQIITFKSKATKVFLEGSMSGTLLEHFQPENLATVKSKTYNVANVNTNKSLFMLFTSWNKDKLNTELKRLVIKQWQALPTTKLCLFTSSVGVLSQINNSDWSTLPMTRTNQECSGFPILPVMFLSAMRKIDAQFYGYSDPAVVFGNGLKRTLDYLKASEMWVTKPLLLVGRHTHLDYSDNTLPVLKTLSLSEISRLATTGKLMSPTVYFISNYLFPWNLAPEVTTGHPLAAEIIITWSLQRDIQVIDATATIQAISVSAKSKVAPKVNSACNEKVIPKILKKSEIMVRGKADCATEETYLTAPLKQKSRVKIRSRKPPTICKS